MAGSAIGEFVYGREHASEQNLVVVNAKHGIGAGILIIGRLFQSDDGRAGEIGHVVVQENGELCRCEKKGCPEMVSSASTILKKLNLDSLDQAQAASEAGDPNNQQAVTDADHCLRLSPANFIGALNLQNIIVTGDVTRFGVFWLETVIA